MERWSMSTALPMVNSSLLTFDWQSWASYMPLDISMNTHMVFCRNNQRICSFFMQSWCDIHEIQSDLLLLQPLLMQVDLGEGQYYNSGFCCHNRAFCLFPIWPFRKGPEMTVSTTVPPCVPVVRISDACMSQWKGKNRTFAKIWQIVSSSDFAVAAQKSVFQFFFGNSYSPRRS